MKNIVKLTVFLAIVAGLAGGLVSYVNSLTSPIIAEKEIAVDKAGLIEIYSNGEEFEKVDESPADFPSIETVYKVNKGSNTVAYIYKTSAAGYGGDVKALISLGIDGKYQGLVITDCSSETKGIGDQITGETFINSIVGKNIGDSIDTISGATFSSAAVITGVEEATAHFNSNYK